MYENIKKIIPHIRDITSGGVNTRRELNTTSGKKRKAIPPKTRYIPHAIMLFDALLIVLSSIGYLFINLFLKIISSLNGLFAMQSMSIIQSSGQ